ncbi:putative phosphoesterase, dhha1 [Sulfurihydrogenibium azorense Az-Fu1]|uniref:Putative phosphoesterase, dhha1 n=1 Tax=Sulfurihydrogenibium azorense (strain DSM 15241 / OCM 825 / Az-Fu1) TaxID=204536 RepID=C1DU14_SULAA|nr:DHHA1 domain-containing protein [Sulfurihydrogenibium azorense]ACN99267.1 putative phosphoesterase, dhha1 [Sulfurihydrogenibium azorense Az-Fu1]
MKTVCIYHKNCTDGTTAAAILLLKYPDCKLFPLDHNYREEEFQPILDEVDKDTTVYIVDFSIKQPFFEKLASKAKEVINIDHHISVKDMLEEFTKKYSNFKLVFDNDKSGASLTWQYLFGSNPPDIVKYVEDKDIWKWEFGDITKYVNDYLFLYTNKPQELRQLLDKDINEIIEKGKIINQYTTYLIDSFVEKSKDLYIQIGSYKVRAYNTGLFQSEIGNKLSTLHNEAVCLFSINGDYVKLSFRSLDHHNPSALDLAKMLNGGGHRNAAGASMNLKEFCNILLI